MPHLISTIRLGLSAKRVLAVLGKRLVRYGLRLHPDKTRFIDFRFTRPNADHRSAWQFDVIVPADTVCSCDAGSSKCFPGSLGAENITGSKAAGAAAASISSSRLKARRHLNIWLVFTPCSCATSATIAPDSIVN
jgi:hypothetical protein